MKIESSRQILNPKICKPCVPRAWAAMITKYSTKMVALDTLKDWIRQPWVPSGYIGLAGFDLKFGPDERMKFPSAPD